MNDQPKSKKVAKIPETAAAKCGKIAPNIKMNAATIKMDASKRGLVATNPEIVAMNYEFSSIYGEMCQ